MRRVKREGERVQTRWKLWLRENRSCGTRLMPVMPMVGKMVGTVRERDLKGMAYSKRIAVCFDLGFRTL